MFISALSLIGWENLSDSSSSEYQEDLRDWCRCGELVMHITWLNEFYMMNDTNNDKYVRGDSKEVGTCVYC